MGRGQIKAGIAASGNTSMETYVNGLLVNDQPTTTVLWIIIQYPLDRNSKAEAKFKAQRQIQSQKSSTSNFLPQ